MDMHSMILYWDKDLICRFANHACEEWFKIMPIDIVDKKNISDLFGNDYLEKTQFFNKEILEGRKQIFKIDIQTKSGELKNAIVTYFPDYSSGEINGFYAQIVDVSSLTNRTSINEIKDAKISHQHLKGRCKPMIDIVVFLKANLTRDFPGIPELAKRTLISESRLKRDFKETYGTTVLDYYRHLQMELAEKYFHEKKTSKKQMAAFLNFSNPSNFSVRYRKYLEEKNNRLRVSGAEKINNETYGIFVSQLPVAAVMLDIQLTFMAASQEWFDSNQLNHADLEGKNLLEIFPDIKIKYQEQLEQCLKKTSESITVIDFLIESGSSKQTRWKVRTWIKENREVGGLIICSQNP